jgi:pimeloyl-ACP methyl ester carboxylesterase
MKFWAEQWDGKAFMAIGAADPVLGLEVMRKLQALIRNCSEPLIIAGGGHFLQEWGAEIAAKAMDYFG